MNILFICDLLEPLPLSGWNAHGRAVRLSQVRSSEGHTIDKMLASIADLVSTGERAGANLSAHEWSYAAIEKLASV